MTLANDLTNIPDFLREIAEETEAQFSDARTGGKSLPPTVRTKGSRFSLFADGDREPAPNETKLAFIVVKVKKPKSRMYYEGRFDVKDENPGPPTCYSLDGVTPEIDSGYDPAWDKGHSPIPNCRSCKWSEYGSKTDDRGNLTTACRAYKQLAVKLIGKPGLWLVNIPIGSAKNWDNYARSIESAAKAEKAERGFATMTLSTIITLAEFDPDTPNVLIFSHKGYISQALAKHPDELKDYLEVRKQADEITRLLWGSPEREAQYAAASGQAVAPAEVVGTPKKGTITYSSGLDTPRNDVPWEDEAYKAHGGSNEPLGHKPGPKKVQPKKPVDQQIVVDATPDAKAASILADLGLDDLDLG